MATGEAWRREKCSAVGLTDSVKVGKTEQGSQVKNMLFIKEDVHLSKNYKIPEDTGSLVHSQPCFMVSLGAG